MQKKDQRIKTQPLLNILILANTYNCEQMMMREDDAHCFLFQEVWGDNWGYVCASGLYLMPRVSLQERFNYTKRQLANASFPCGKNDYSQNDYTLN